MTAETTVTQLEASLDRAYAEIERLRAVIKQMTNRLNDNLETCDAVDGPEWLDETREIGLAALNQQRVEITETENPGTEVKVIR